MGYLSKKQTLWGLLIALVCFHSSCQKEQIAPPNQNVAFVKYFGHVGDQKASDIIRTIDGGFMMVGSTNSYSNQSESDLFIVKTDSLGNEVWSKSFGKYAGPGTGVSLGKYVRYDEEGIKIVASPDGMIFTIAVNRTYYEYVTQSSTDRFPLKTKVVMYQIDGEGGLLTALDGVELRSTTNFTEKVSDMKIDTTGGIINYILTGYTTQIAGGKPLDPNNGIFDKTDIFTILIDETFTQLWNTGVLAYGFVGEDYGASVQILPDGYLITGTVEEQYDYPGGAFIPKVIAVKMKKSNGAPLNPQYFGDKNYTFEGGYSTYDNINRRITLVASVIDGNNLYIGHAGVLQIDENLTAVQVTGPFGFHFYKPTPPTKLPSLALIHRYSPKSIALLPNSAGFLVSMTHEKNPTEYNVAVMKVNSTLDEKASWTYYFGYEDLDGGTSIQDQEAAGTVMPVVNQVAGTTQSTLSGYVVTGTFHVGTNNMMGLIKMNINGELKP